MKSLLIILSLAIATQANPIVVEPVNPLSQSGVVKAIESIPSVIAQAVQAAQPAPSSYNVGSPVVAENKVPANVVQHSPVVSDVAPVAPVASVAPVVQPSSYQAVQPSVPVVEKKNPEVVPAVEVQPSSYQPVVSEVKSVDVVPQVGPVVPQVVPVESKVVPAVPSVESVAEKNIVDQSQVYSGSIDQATKLIIDLDEHIKKYLPAEDEIVTTIAPHIYSGDVAESEAERQQNQMSALIDQVNRLAESIENTITDLVARRRYVTAAMLRSMLNYVRRVRVNLERLQNRLQSVQAVATSGQNSPPGAPAASNIPGAAFFNTIRERINRMTEEIGALVTRIRGSFNPAGSVVSTSPLPPLVTSANIQSIGAAAAAGSIVSAINTVNSVPQNAAAAVAAVAAAAQAA